MSYNPCEYCDKDPAECGEDPVKCTENAMDELRDAEQEAGISRHERYYP